MISQLTVFLENKKGHLARACAAIAEAGFDMKALFLADTADFGIARIFCDRPLAAAAALSEAGFRAKIVPVLAVRVPHRRGGLAELLAFLDAADVNIEYSYCFSVGADTAVDVLKVGTDDVEGRLAAAGFEIVQEKEVYELG